MCYTTSSLIFFDFRSQRSLKVAYSRSREEDVPTFAILSKIFSKSWKWEITLPLRSERQMFGYGGYLFLTAKMWNLLCNSFDHGVIN